MRDVDYIRMGCSLANESVDDSGPSAAFMINIFGKMGSWGLTCSLIFDGPSRPGAIPPGDRSETFF